MTIVKQYKLNQDKIQSYTKYNFKETHYIQIIHTYNSVNLVEVSKLVDPTELLEHEPYIASVGIEIIWRICSYIKGGNCVTLPYKHHH